MDFHKVLDDEEFSVGIAPVSTMGEDPADEAYVWLDALMPQMTAQATSVEVTRTKQSHGAGSAPHVGKVWHTLVLKQRWQGQASGFLHSDTPAFTALARYLEALTGSATLAYAAGDLTGTDANTVAAQSEAKNGCLLAAREGDVVTPLAFVEQTTGAGPYTIALGENGPVVLGEDVSRASTKTWYPNGGVAPKFAVRVTGRHEEQDHKFLGTVLQRVSITWDEDDSIWLEVTVMVYGGYVQGTGGGLRQITQYRSMEAVLDRPGARVMLASNWIASQDNGTAQPAGTCAVRDLALTLEFPHFVVRCPPNTSAPEGVADVVLRPPSITGACAVPHIPDWDENDSSRWVTAFRTQQHFSISAFQGNALGRVMAWRVGRAYLTAYPELASVEGVYHRQLQWRAGHNNSEAAATDAGHKALVLALA